MCEETIDDSRGEDAMCAEDSWLSIAGAPRNIQEARRAWDEAETMTSVRAEASPWIADVLRELADDDDEPLIA